MDECMCELNIGFLFFYRRHVIKIGCKLLTCMGLITSHFLQRNVCHGVKLGACIHFLVNLGSHAFLSLRWIVLKLRRDDKLNYGGDFLVLRHKSRVSPQQNFDHCEASTSKGENPGLPDVDCP